MIPKKAIVNGDPPDLPAEGFTEAARNFVNGCLNKIPNLHPTYAMLLQHAWLAPLTKPEAIMEEDEDEAGEAASPAENTQDRFDDLRLPPDVVDKEVGLWVIETLEAKRAGKLARADKPALHAAPLDAVASTSPAVEKKDGGFVGQDPPAQS
jgi:mitogen-activated protein kinase kinase